MRPKCVLGRKVMKKLFEGTNYEKEGVNEEKYQRTSTKVDWIKEHYKTEKIIP